jgi:hypothetical protein
MSYTKRLAAAVLLLVPVLAVGACTDSDEPTSPIPVTALEGKTTSSKSLTSTREAASIEWLPVLRNVTNWEDIYASATIGPKGGTLTAGEMTLTIPRDALAQETQITMVTLQGDKMYVLFWPHGLTFAKPATLSFDLEQTNGANAAASDLKGVYFESLFDSTPAVLESYSVSRNGKYGQYSISHFSYYSLYLKRGYTAAGAD